MSSFSCWPLIRASYLKKDKKMKKASTMEVTFENPLHEHLYGTANPKQCENKYSTKHLKKTPSLLPLTMYSKPQTNLVVKQEQKTETPRNPLDANSDEYFWKPVSISLMFQPKDQTQWLQDQEEGWNIRSPYEHMTGVWWACKKK